MFKKSEISIYTNPKSLCGLGKKLSGLRVFYKKCFTSWIYKQARFIIRFSIFTKAFVNGSYFTLLYPEYKKLHNKRISKIHISVTVKQICKIRSGGVNADEIKSKINKFLSRFLHIAFIVYIVFFIKKQNAKNTTHNNVEITKILHDKFIYDLIRGCNSMFSNILFI